MKLLKRWWKAILATMAIIAAGIGWMVMRRRPKSPDRTVEDTIDKGVASVNDADRELMEEVNNAGTGADVVNRLAKGG